MESDLRAYHQLFAERFVLRGRRRGRRALAEPAELWLDEGAIAIHQAEAAKTVGHPDGCLALVSAPLPGHYPGLAGPGEAAPGPAAIYLIYFSPLGATPLDRRLFLPEDWFTADRPQAGLEYAIPAWVTYHSGPALGSEMVLAALAGGLAPVRAVALGGAFGRDQRLLDQLHQSGHTFVMEVSREQPIWIRAAGKPAHAAAWRAQPADEFAARLPPEAWQPAGPDGQIVARQVALDRAQRLGPEGWLVVRRPADLPAVDRWRFCLSNADARADLRSLAGLTDWEAPVGQVLRDCRSVAATTGAPGWAGWHHDTTLTMLAHHFVVRLRRRYGPAAPALDVAQARQILQTVLPQAEFDLTPALAEIERIQLHNLAAFPQRYDPGETAGGAEWAP